MRRAADRTARRRPAGGPVSAPGSSRLRRTVARRRLGKVVVTALLAVVLLIAVGAGLLWYAPFLRIASVDYRTTPERLASLRQVASVPEGEPMVEVDAAGLENRILGTQLFADASVRRSWPSTLVVEATPRTPVVAVREAGESGVRLVDGSGVAFERVDTPPSGLLVADAPGRADAAVLGSLVGVVNGLGRDLADTVTDLRVDGSGSVSMQVRGVQVAWGDAKDARLKGALVRQLVGRPDVARIDVTAPLAPVTSQRRLETPGPGSVGGPAGTASPSWPSATGGAPTDAGAPTPGGPPTDSVSTP